jgi:TatD DNase family protein
MPELIDIGLNLAHDSFDPDRAQVVARAREAGVGRLIITGADVATSARAIELCSEDPSRRFATAGVHPHHADAFDPSTTAALTGLAGNDAVVAIGECGLDFHRNFSTRENQRLAFRAQLELAAELGLPVFLHQREAHTAFIADLEPFRQKLAGGVAHCFTGGPEELAACLALDLHIGITGWVCDERRGEALRAAVPGIPRDRLLIETDAPYLLPRDLEPRPGSRRNEPAHLPHILDRIAELMQVPADELAQDTTHNAERLFRLPPVG